MKRAEKYRCIDKRTNDEKAKDSLDRQIDFKFFILKGIYD